MKLSSVIVLTLALGLTQLATPSHAQSYDRFVGVATEALLGNHDGSRTRESLLFTIDKWTGAVSVCALSSGVRCKTSSPLLPGENRTRFSVIQPPSIGIPDKSSAVVYLLDIATGRRWQVSTDSRDAFGNLVLQLRNIYP